MLQVIISVDIGTSSSKAIAYSGNGDVIASAKKTYGFLDSPPGYQEQDADIILNAVLHILSSIIGEMDGKAEIAGFSFSCAMHGLMAVDKDHKPLTGIITWADTRSIREAAYLNAETSRTDLYRRTGLPVHPMTPFCKIYWLRQHRPEIFQAAGWFIGFKEYLFHHLFDKYLLDYSLAASTGLFNVHQLKWDPEALDIIGVLESQLPVAVDCLHAEYKLNESLRKKWKLQKEIPFYIGSSDGCLANLGTGATEPGVLAVTIGTSGAVRVARSTPGIDSGKKTFNYPLLPGLIINGGPINNGGILLKWFSENFHGRAFTESSDFNWFLEEAGQSPPGSNGLICLPYLIGERAPVWDASASGIFYGLRLHHQRSDFMRSMVEGITMNLYQVAEILEECNGKPKQIIASGGFIQSPLWVQIMADIFRVPVRVTNEMDASAIGAAMLGWVALGQIKSIEETGHWVKFLANFHPDPALSEIYQSNFKVFRQLFERNQY